MSMIACSCCGRFEDTDGDFGLWDVRKVNSDKKYEYICGICKEKYVTEDEKFDPDLEEAA